MRKNLLFLIIVAFVILEFTLFSEDVAIKKSITRTLPVKEESAIKPEEEVASTVNIVHTTETVTEEITTTEEPVTYEESTVEEYVEEEPTTTEYEDIYEYGEQTYGYLGCYTLTAYEWTGNPCANGNYPTEGYTVACNSLPLGTRIYIEGYGEYVVEDRGGMADSVIDIYLGDYDTCIQFGVCDANVYIVE